MDCFRANCADAGGDVSCPVQQDVTGDLPSGWVWLMITVAEPTFISGLLHRIKEIHVKVHTLSALPNLNPGVYEWVTLCWITIWVGV